MISPEYRATLEAMHAESPWGTKGYHYAAAVRAFKESLPTCRTILDYGSGAESLAKACPDLDIRCYDPGVPARAAPPEPADLVVCTDVLEHIEPAYLDDVLKHISTLARVGIFLHIATKLAKRTLPDGRNAHLIVERPAWWLAKLGLISDRWRVQDHTEGTKTLRVQLTRKP